MNLPFECKHFGAAGINKLLEEKGFCAIFEDSIFDAYDFYDQTGHMPILPTEIEINGRTFEIRFVVNYYFKYTYCSMKRIIESQPENYIIGGDIFTFDIVKRFQLEPNYIRAKKASEYLLHTGVPKDVVEILWGYVWIKL